MLFWAEKTLTKFLVDKANNELLNLKEGKKEESQGWDVIWQSILWVPCSFGYSKQHIGRLNILTRRRNSHLFSPQKRELFLQYFSSHPHRFPSQSFSSPIPHVPTFVAHQFPLSLSQDQLEMTYRLRVNEDHFNSKFLWNKIKWEKGTSAVKVRKNRRSLLKRERAMVIRQPNKRKRFLQLF